LLTLKDPAQRSVCATLTTTLVLLCTLLAAPAYAQEFRGAVEGRVTDDTGAAVPGATVTITHVETNVASTTVTNENGNYTVPFLTPGTYKVSVELPGFKKVERDQVQVRVADKLVVDFQLEVGRVEEVIAVSAAAPLLETRSGSSGQVIDEKRIALMPLSDGNPFVLTRLAPGVAYFGDLKFSRPFDNGGTSDITTDGAAGGNEFSLDGSPNMAHGRRVAFVPPAGAVSEFKVETANFDAQQGHTAGATINVTLKSGTNRFKGEGYYHHRDEKLSSNDFFLERQGQPKAPLDYKRFGGVLGGPIFQDRTFFFTAVEWLYDEFPEPEQFTVPTEAQRNGDFSALLAQGITIYDPATARLVDGRVVRTPFANNVIPSNRISPIAREYLKFYPLPNQAGDAQGRNNFISSQPRGDDFYSISTRVDHQINGAQKIFGRYSRNDRVEYRGNWTGELNGINPTGNFLYRINDALNIDHVWTMNSTTLLNVRGSWSQFDEPSIRQHQGVYDPANLGFSSQTTALFGGARYLPRFDLDAYSDLGDSFAGFTKSNIYSFQPTMTRIMGNHSFRAGYDFRIYREQSVPNVAAAGEYQFRGDFTRERDNSTNAAIGQDLAAFLLGQPTGGRIDRSADRFNQSIYQAVFFQDDWKISDKLTLNLGLRYDYEGAPTERDNRNVRGFDPNAELAITNAAQAAYAANPIPQIAPSAFRVRGGLGFANDQNRGFWNTDKNNIQPRLGLAYQVNDKTVIRGGWAIYTVPAVIDGVRQPGFSQPTPIVPTLDNGLTFQATLFNPFPNGAAEPPGSSLGPNTFVGRQLPDTGNQTIRFMDDLNYRNPQAMRWAFTVQRELGAQWVLDASYVGNRGYDLTTEYELNALPREFLTTSSVRDDTTINFLTANVTNPFRGLLPGEGLNSSTVQRHQLLRPYPQFLNIQGRRYDGKNRYDAGQFRLERRFRDGYSMIVSYTVSRLREQLSLLNDTDAEYEDRIARNDIPHRLVLNPLIELPFGRDRKFGRDVNPFVNALIGDWNVSIQYQWQSGRPLDLNERNVYFNGDPTQLKADYSGDPDQPVFDISNFYFHDAAVQTNGVDDPTKQRNDTRIRLERNIRTFPSRLSNLHGPQLNYMDISFVKGIQLAGRVRAQLHLELYNAFNQVFYSDPNTDPRNSNFGKVTQQNNLPRNFQIGTKVTF
jgi:Carboxypeptidase regulatory-like domain/TonB dependent receptor